MEIIFNYIHHAFSSHHLLGYLALAIVLAVTVCILGTVFRIGLHLWAYVQDTHILNVIPEFFLTIDYRGNTPLDYAISVKEFNAIIDPYERRKYARIAAKYFEQDHYYPHRKELLEQIKEDGYGYVIPDDYSSMYVPKNETGLLIALAGFFTFLGVSALGILIVFAQTFPLVTTLAISAVALCHVTRYTLHLQSSTCGEQPHIG